MDPATIAALTGLVASTVSGGMKSSSSDKATKRQAKENKRQTLADMYNKALQREYDLYKFTQENSGTNSARRAAALSETANGFSRALTGR